MKVLDIGSGPDSQAHSLFQKEKNLKVVRLDVDPGVHPDVVHDIVQPLPEALVGQFDIVLASHVLEHVNRYQVMQTVKNIVSAVKPGGEVWLLVPSLEWAAEMILKDQAHHPGVQVVLWGTQEDEYYYHKSGFTLPLLRMLLSEAGCVVRKAHQAMHGGTHLGDDGQQYSFQFLQNVVIGAKLALPESEE